MLRQEIVEEGMHPETFEGALLYANRHLAWLKHVQGRTWTAACSNDWHLRSEWDCHIEVQELRNKGFLFTEQGEIEHIVDLSTLTLVQR